MNPHRVRMSVVLLALVSIALLGSALPREAHAITPEQCQFFAQNGKVLVCHRTASPKNPYISVLATVEACIHGFAPNPGDFIGYGDPLCNGSSCLAQGTPCDATIECCDGSTCNAGTCQPN